MIHKWMGAIRDVLTDFQQPIPRIESYESKEEDSYGLLCILCTWTGRI